MLVYKLFYNKLMDDLKDASMWLDWAEQIECDYPDYAKFLVEQAKERICDQFPETYEKFRELCNSGKVTIDVDSVIGEHLCEWHHSLKRKVEEMEDTKKMTVSIKK